MKITYAEEKDIAAIATAEAACFPPTEAATEQEFVERIKYYGNHFWLLYDAAKLPSSRLQTAAKATANGSDRFSRSNGCTQAFTGRYLDHLCRCACGVLSQGAGRPCGGRSAYLR